MSKAVWALQNIVALAFLAAGTMKLITPKEQLVGNGRVQRRPRTA